MDEKLNEKLTGLRNEAELGSRRLHELEIEVARVRETLLRIDGAILVLEELLPRDEAATNGDRPVAVAA